MRGETLKFKASNLLLKIPDCSTGNLSLSEKYAIGIKAEAAVPYEEAETVTHEQSLEIECSPDFSASENSTNSSIAAVCSNGSFYYSENILLEDIETQLQCFAG